MREARKEKNNFEKIMRLTPDSLRMRDLRFPLCHPALIWTILIKLLAQLYIFNICRVLSLLADMKMHMS